MIVLAGGDLVLADRVLERASLVLDAGVVSAIDRRPAADPGGARVIDTTGCYVVPGFVDVHVHGVDGIDTLDGDAALAQMAARLPRYGVTAFCPTTTACPPAALRAVLQQVSSARVSPVAGGARVLPAHLESNFINPDYRGAQPADCLRRPGSTADGHAPDRAQGRQAAGLEIDHGRGGADFSAADILDVIAAARADVGIVTLAPELPGGLDLVRTLIQAGHRVSLGHSGASVEEALAAIDAGARQATHLFNRMAPMTHRSPGLAGAVLSRAEIAAELICDGFHVHPAMCGVAIRAKGADRVMAITDGTAGSGLPVGSEARLGGRRIRVTDRAAVLDDGTLAGSTLTMDRAFATIVRVFGLPLTDAVALCSRTPARELGLAGRGELTEGAAADVTVLDRTFAVVRTFVGGRQVYPRDAAI